MAYLTVRIKGVEGYSKRPLDKDRIVAGRASEADLQLAHSSVSREHFAVVKAGEGDAWAIEDLGSANGTLVNKVKVAGRVPLKERDIISAGQARVTFHAGSADKVEAAVDIRLDAGADGPVRRRQPGDPADAMPCGGCGTWLSIAHKMPADRLSCPRCRHDNVVVNLVD